MKVSSSKAGGQDKLFNPKENSPDLFGEEPKPQGKKFISDETIGKTVDEITNKFSKSLTGDGGKFILDAKDLKNLGIIGAGYVQKGIYEFRDWSKEMLKEYPDFKDNLKEIWEHIKENYKDLFPIEKDSDMKKEIVKKAVLAFFLLLCLISLLYPPYINGDMSRPRGDGYIYLQPEYVRKFLLYHDTNNINGHDYPERINVAQLLCELSAILTLFFLVDIFWDIKPKRRL
jgi:hypothetical protein